MTKNIDEKDVPPFLKQVEKLEEDGQRGITQGQLLLVVGAVALLAAWGIGLQVYQPTMPSPPQEEAAGPADQKETGGKPRSAVRAPEVKVASPQLAWRDQALEAFEELTARLRTLERKAVQQWAAVEYDQLMETVTSGELAYNEQRFRDARERYQESLEQVGNLEAKMPEVFASLVARGMTFIAEKKYTDALEALDVAGLIDPENESVATAINTARHGEAVDRLLTKARFALGEGQASEALALLKEAASLDPARADVKGLTTDAKALSRRLAFRGHMRSGHAALAAARFAEAITAFSKAVALEPNNPEATSALQSAEKQSLDHQLNGLQQQAAAAMQQEAWAVAEQLYKDALSLQDGVAFAAEGLKRAIYYREKQHQVQSLLAKPDRLADHAVAQHAETVVAALEKEAELPPGLALSKEKLASTLEAYSQLVPVMVHSDGRSAISLIRGKSFKPFRQMALQLRPGQYTLLARREGYRDKRVSFLVPLDGKPITVSIGADEKF